MKLHMIPSIDAIPTIPKGNNNCIETPQHSAVVQVCFFDESSTYDRSFLLIGDDYLNWTTDEYLYEYINSHFMQIFDK